MPRSAPLVLLPLRLALHRVSNALAATIVLLEPPRGLVLIAAWETTVLMVLVSQRPVPTKLYRLHTRRGTNTLSEFKALHF